MTQMNRPEDDLGNRRPVWEALSEFYIDRQLQDFEYAHIAEVLDRSPYAADDLERILFEELHPVLAANLDCVAGSWTGFDPAEMESAILQRHQRSPGASNTGSATIREEWSKVRSLLGDR